MRFAVGTVAQIVEAAELPDGRFALGTVGVARIRIVQWLDDDPYPRAEVEEWAEPAPTPDARRDASTTTWLCSVACSR